MVIYRVFSQESKTVIKLLHMFIQTVAFIVAVIGLKAAFDFHNHLNIPNMYSLHSWLGTTVVLLFTAQVNLINCLVAINSQQNFYSIDQNPNFKDNR